MASICRTTTQHQVDDIFEAYILQESRIEDLGSNELDQSMLDDLFALDDEDGTTASTFSGRTDPGKSKSDSDAEYRDVCKRFWYQMHLFGATNLSTRANKCWRWYWWHLLRRVYQNEQNDPFIPDNIVRDIDKKQRSKQWFASDDDIENILAQFDQPVESEEEQESVDLAWRAISWWWCALILK